MRPFVHVHRRFLLAIPILALVVFASASISRAQAPAPSAPATGQQPDQATPDSGGPGADSGVIVLPKKKEQPADLPPPAPAAPVVKNPEGAANFSLRVEVPEVTVDVGVLVEKTDQFVSNLKPGNFRVYEDGVEQKVTSFKRVEAPITALMLCEFARTNYAFVYDMRNAAMTFANQLRPQDNVALMTFDMHTQIVTDFTQDKRQIQEAIATLRASTSATSSTPSMRRKIAWPASRAANTFS
jgi:hypothetical protein